MEIFILFFYLPVLNTENSEHMYGGCYVCVLMLANNSKSIKTQHIILISNGCFSSSVSDLWNHYRPGGPECEGGAAALGPEDDPEVSRGQCSGLHPVMARWARLQRHYPPQQVHKLALRKPQISSLLWQGDLKNCRLYFCSEIATNVVLTLVVR